MMALVPVLTETEENSGDSLNTAFKTWLELVPGKHDVSRGTRDRHCLVSDFAILSFPQLQFFD